MKLDDIIAQAESKGACKSALDVARNIQSGLIEADNFNPDWIRWLINNEIESHILRPIYDQYEAATKPIYDQYLAARKPLDDKLFNDVLEQLEWKENL